MSAVREYVASSKLDRVESLRGDPGHVAALWRRPDARVLQVTSTGALVAGSDGGPALVDTEGDWDADRDLLLGLVAESPHFLTLAADGPALDFRTAALSWDDTLTDLAVMAMALGNWHRDHPFCPRCGAPTSIAMAGLARRCESCGEHQFPRTDPAMIVAVRDADDRLLLARQPVWAPHRYSLLAGFATAGETIEACVRREVLEEAGVRVGEVRYVGNQPWPFPRSFMIGCQARALTTEIVIDGLELEDARWVSRPELDSFLASGEVGLPPSVSIAYSIISAWRRDELPPLG